MTESLLNKYDFSRKAPEVPVKHSPSGEERQRTGTERTVGFHCDWLKNIRVGEARIFRIVYDWQRCQLITISSISIIIIVVVVKNGDSACGKISDGVCCGVEVAATFTRWRSGATTPTTGCSSSPSPS